MKLNADSFPLEFRDLTINTVDEFQNILFKAKLFPKEQKKTEFLGNKIEQAYVYVRMLMDGDPENENPKEILEKLEEILEK